VTDLPKSLDAAHLRARAPCCVARPGTPPSRQCWHMASAPAVTMRACSSASRDRFARTVIPPHRAFSRRWLIAAVMVMVMGCVTPSPSAQCPEAAAQTTGRQTQPVQAKSLCVVADVKVGFQTLIEVRYTKPRPMTQRAIWYFNCNRATYDCSGARFAVDRLEQGQPVGMFDLNELRGATLVSVTGSVAVIEWGLFRTFTIDLLADQVTYAESGDDVEGRGSGRCLTL
jgi:hypothetical protein